MKGITIEERACLLARYIIDSKDTVRGAAKKFGISKSTVHTEVTFQNGKNKSPIIPERIEIKKVFLAEKNPVDKLGLVIIYLDGLFWFVNNLISKLKMIIQ